MMPVQEVAWLAVGVAAAQVVAGVAAAEGTAGVEGLAGRAVDMLEDAVEFCFRFSFLCLL